MYYNVLNKRRGRETQMREGDCTTPERSSRRFFGIFLLQFRHLIPRGQESINSFLVPFKEQGKKVLSFTLHSLERTFYASVTLE